MQLARFVDDLVPFYAMEVMERGMQLQREGHDVLQLAVGEPAFEAPAPVVEATIAALQRGETHYTSSRGLHALCEAIAQDTRVRRGVELSPERAAPYNASMSRARDQRRRACFQWLSLAIVLVAIMLPSCQKLSDIAPGAGIFHKV